MSPKAATSSEIVSVYWQQWEREMSVTPEPSSGPQQQQQGPGKTLRIACPTILPK